jgi:hypothetical protein
MCPSLPVTLVCTSVPQIARKVRRKLQRGLNSFETWCKRWNIKMNEDMNRAVYFTHRLGSPEAHLRMNGRNIPFVNHVKYVDVIFDKRITRRLHIEMVEIKVFKTST